MSWIVFVLAFQLGYLPGSSLVMYDPPSYLDGSGQFYQQAEAKIVLWDFLEVGGSMRVYDWISKPGNGIGFWPSQLDSVFFADVFFGPVMVGWIHECDHPIMPFQQLYDIKAKWEGSRDEIFVRVELKL